MLTWRRFFRRNRLDEEVARDLQFYVDAETDDNIARGMPPAQARDAALRKLGNPTLLREEVYRMNTAGFFETIWHDLRYAVRVLRQSPAFTATAVLSLALGIGGNSAVFTVVRGVLLKPLPYRNAERLVKVGGTVDFTTTFDLRSRTRSFESLSLYENAAGAVVENGQAELLDGMRVNYDYFETLGVETVLGRTFLPEEDRPDRRFQVILTHGLWTRRFGGNPQILGRSIRMDDRAFTVVGILPRGFRPLGQTDGVVLPEYYIPLGYALNQPNACRGCQHLQLIGRLKPGVTVEQAREDVASIMRDLVREHPTEYGKGETVPVTPLLDHFVSRVSTALWVLLGSVGLVLLMACANVANLVLSRATRRAQEMALRSALGAGRLRLVRQLTIECLLLAIGGGAVGLLLASAATTALSAYGSRQLPRIAEVGVDTPVLWFTFGVSLLTVALFGVLPAFRVSRVDLAASLKDTTRSSDGRGRNALRSLLVTVELALAFVLLMGAALLGKSFLRLTSVHPGYDPHNVLTLGLHVYGERYRKPEVELGFYRQVLDRLRVTAGVESAAMVSTLPLASFDRHSFYIEDRPLANPSDAPSVDAYSITTDYFRVMRIPLKRGRVFTEADRQGAPRVALISESCARAMFADRDPIGLHIQLSGQDPKLWATVIGVVGDIRQYGLDRPSRMEAYVAQAQDVGYGYNLVARTAGDPRRMEKTVRDVMRTVDRTQPAYHVYALEDYVADSLAERSLTLSLLGLFGGLALVLAAVGIYGVISYAVSARTRELGIRMALGAGRRDVLSMVLRRGMILIAAGLPIGLGASLVLDRFLATLLYEVEATDPMTALATAVGLSAVALLATLVPANRATRIDPVAALR